MCLCGKRGCVERLASGPYIVQQVRQWLQEQPEKGQILRDIVENHFDRMTAQCVSQAAMQGDELSQKAIKLSGWAIGVAIGNTANLINPQRFVLGGGVTKAGDLFWDEVRRVARQTALPEIHFDIVPALLGEEAPLWGAVALAESVITSEEK